MKMLRVVGEKGNRLLAFAESADAGKRLDIIVMQILNENAKTKTAVSRSFVQRMIDDGMVLVNGAEKSKNHRVSPCESLDVVISEPRELLVLAEDISLDIRYEDNDLLVVNKPKGMVVHPAAGHAGGTLVNALLYHCADSLSGINGVKRPGIVHRIDKETSGLLVVAKNDNAHVSLAEQLSTRSMEREYRAVCHGTLNEERGVIDRPIGRDAKDRKKFSVASKGGKQAVTEYGLVRNYERYSHIFAKLHTGRTHQLRVHMASVGHPVAGDRVYGPRTTPAELGGQCLHAKVLGFIHPVSGLKMRFDSELPDYFLGFLSKLERKGFA